MKTATKAFPSYSTIVDKTTGITYQLQYDLFTVGAGYLDVNGALNSVDLISVPSTTPLSPKVKFDASTKKTTLDASSLVWGDSSTWGNHGFGAHR